MECDYDSNPSESEHPQQSCFDSRTQAELDPWSTWMEAASQGSWPKDFGFLLHGSADPFNANQDRSRSSSESSMCNHDESEKLETHCAGEYQMLSLHGSIDTYHKTHRSQLSDQVTASKNSPSWSLSPPRRRSRRSLFHGLTPIKLPQKKHGARVSKFVFRVASRYRGIKM